MRSSVFPASEISQAEIFAQMLSEVEKFELFENYPGKCVAHMKACTSEIIVPASVLKEWRGKADPIAALDFGIRREPVD